MGYRLNHRMIWGGAILLGVAALGWWLTPYFKGNLELNPVLLQIGGLTIYWYGLTMALAAIAAWSWFRLRALPHLSETHIANLSIWLLLAGLLGARLLFVALKWPEFSQQSIWQMLDLHSGGLSIHGALIGGLVAAWLYTKTHHLPLLNALDWLVPPVILGQIIGRLGNFFNQEAFGGPTDLPWKMFVSSDHRPAEFSGEMFFHPTFLYSMIGLALVLLVVLWVEKKFVSPGRVIWVYAIAYSLERIVIEQFRVDSDHLASLTLAQWGSVLIIIFSLLISLIWRYKHRR